MNTSWWEATELPIDAKANLYERFKFAIAMLDAALSLADAWWSAAIANYKFMFRTDPILPAGLFAQRATLLGDVFALKATLGTARRDNTLRTVLGKRTASSRWYYGDGARSDVVRYRQEPYNPFLIVNTMGAYSMFVPGEGTMSPVLVDAAGVIYTLGYKPLVPGAGAAQLSDIVTVAAVHPMAFVDPSGESAPASGNSFFLGDSGSLVITTEDAVHVVVGKLLDFCRYVQAAVQGARFGWQQANPSSQLQLPPIPPPVPVVLPSEAAALPAVPSQDPGATATGLPAAGALPGPAKDAGSSCASPAGRMAVGAAIGAVAGAGASMILGAKVGVVVAVGAAAAIAGTAVGAALAPSGCTPAAKPAGP